MSHGAAKMREDWDAFARLNPLHFICSQKDEWCLEDFWRSGEEDVERYLMPHVRRVGIEPSQACVLDFGCGVGRLSLALSRRFLRVTAYDVSLEMLSKGKTLLADVPNITWVLGDGIDLSTITSDSHDVTFSYITIQHIPHTNLALKQIAELCRVTSPGGMLCIQFSHRRFYRLRRLHVAIRARIARSRLGWRLIPRCWHERKYGREEIVRMETLMQHSLNPSDVVRVVQQAGLTITWLDTSDAANVWLVATK